MHPVVLPVCNDLHRNNAKDIKTKKIPKHNRGPQERGSNRHIQAILADFRKVGLFFHDVARQNSLRRSEHVHS